MIKNYFKIAWRNFRKNKLYATINANRIVRVTMEYSTGGSVSKFAQTGTKAGPQFKRTFPEIEDYTQLMKYQRVIGYGEKLFTEKNFLYADPSFFNIFSFPFAEGNANDALSSKDKIVLTQSARFISESMLTAFIAAAAALLLSTLLIPVLNNVSGKHLSISTLFQLKPVLYLLAGTFIVGFAASVYPAMVLSGNAITRILKKGFSFSASGNNLRKTLIVFQFFISVFLIITTIIIVQQIDYIRHKDLGYDKDHVLELPVDRRSKQDYYTLKKELSALRDVRSVTGAYSSPVQVEWGDAITTNNGHDKINISINAIPVDLDFIKMLNMKIIAGSDYTMADLQQLKESQKNNRLQYAYMLNEATVKKIGWTAEQAIGKTIGVGEARQGIVKAVVKDFNFRSMHEPIGPLMLFLDTQWVRNAYIKVAGNNLPATIQQIQAIWKAYIPYRPFEYRFLDDEFNGLYKTEQRTAQLLSIFSCLAILLACLGLFGLAAFTTVQRTREIGVRKVLGASVSGIATLLSKDFVKLVLIASLIAFPVAWFAIHKWLQDFAYRTDINWWVFVVAAVGALLIALITVSFHAIKAALANPVKSLRAE